MSDDKKVQWVGNPPEMKVGERHEDPTIEITIDDITKEMTQEWIDSTPKIVTCSECDELISNLSYEYDNEPRCPECAVAFRQFMEAVTNMYRVRLSTDEPLTRLTDQTIDSIVK